MAERLCPGCGLRLSTSRLGSALLDLCRHCGGVWLNSLALWELLNSGAGTIRRLHSEQRLIPPQPPHGHHPSNCPYCSGQLARMVVPELPDVPLHSCPPCRGFWLTGEALEQLATAAQSYEAQAFTGATPLSLRNCAHCGERNVSTAAYCWDCGRRLQVARPELARDGSAPGR